MAFLTDAMLGRLTRYLRMMGYDVVYAPDVNLETDDEIIAFAERTDRRIITRDTEITARTDAMQIDSLEIEDQLRELQDHGFTLRLTEPSRCSLCNAELRETNESPDHVATGEVWRCVECGQHYWKGSHWRDVIRTLEEIRDS